MVLPPSAFFDLEMHMGQGPGSAVNQWVTIWVHGGMPFKTRMHTGLESSSLRRSPSDCGDPVAFRCCFTALKGQHTLAWGNAPGKPDHEDQSPERANHGRMLDRRPRSGALPIRSGRFAARAKIGRPFRARDRRAAYLGRCPRQTCAAPLGRKEKAGRTAHKINNLAHSSMERHARPVSETAAHAVAIQRSCTRRAEDRWIAVVA